MMAATGTKGRVRKDSMMAAKTTGGRVRKRSMMAANRRQMNSLVFVDVWCESDALVKCLCSLVVFIIQDPRDVKYTAVFVYFCFDASFWIRRLNFNFIKFVVEQKVNRNETQSLTNNGK
jgi:hypothetical protein